MLDIGFSPEGPFLNAEWGVFIPLENFERVIEWVMQNRGSYDVLIHPNTGCMIEDHSDWAIWAG